MTTPRRLPSHLHTAYNWVESAGALDECRDDVNYPEAPDFEDAVEHGVSLKDLDDLRVWLRADRSPYRIDADSLGDQFTGDLGDCGRLAEILGGILDWPVKCEQHIGQFPGALEPTENQWNDAIDQFYLESPNLWAKEWTEEDARELERDERADLANDIARDERE